GRPLRLVVDGRYRLIRCGTCGTEYLRPDPRLGRDRDARTVSEYWERYKFDLYADAAVQHDYEQRYTDALREAERLVGPIGTVLDVGCGIGNFVAFAQARLIRAYGVDVDADAIATARSRGLTVAESHELDGMIPDSGVDAVTLWDVIEHLYEPEPVVRGVLSKLRPGGALVLETPDVAFPVRRLVLAVHALSRGRVDLTGHLYYWEHKIYFTEAGLRAILGRLGCEVCHVKHETSPRHKMQEIFAHYARESMVNRLLAALWPLLESGTRRLGRGNKLILVARSRNA
ncbi:MAG TPA: class I SAM-dependent methyltransferase, partial [Kribbellaceae bacterium]|nr:class I SAM-dependent methyltransferase [Kribbellaceae bacterium]